MSAAVEISGVSRHFGGLRAVDTAAEAYSAQRLPGAIGELGEAGNGTVHEPSAALVAEDREDHVLERGELDEDVRDLEGAADAERGATALRQGRDVGAEDGDPPPGRS